MVGLARAFLVAPIALTALAPVAPAAAKAERYRVTYARGFVRLQLGSGASQGVVKHTLSKAKRGGSLSYDPSNGEGSGSFPANASTTASVGSCTDRVAVRRERIEILPRAHRREEVRFTPAPDRASDVLATKCAAPGLSDLPAAQRPFVPVAREPFANDTVRLLVRWSGPVSTGTYTGTLEMRFRLVLRRSTNAASGR